MFLLGSVICWWGKWYKSNQIKLTPLPSPPAPEDPKHWISSFPFSPNIKFQGPNKWQIVGLLTRYSTTGPAANTESHGNKKISQIKSGRISSATKLKLSSKHEIFKTIRISFYISPLTALILTARLRSKKTNSSGQARGLLVLQFS